MPEVIPLARLKTALSLIPTRMRVLIIPDANHPDRIPAMNAKYMTNGALLVGRVVQIGDIVKGANLGVMPENAERFSALNRRYRIRGHFDGWFVDGVGHCTQIWEYGIGRLGLTVTGPKLVARCLRLDWLKRRGIGDREANFNCPWDDEHLEKLEKLVKLQKRRSSVASAENNGDAN